MSLYVIVILLTAVLTGIVHSMVLVALLAFAVLLGRLSLPLFLILVIVVVVFRFTK